MESDGWIAGAKPPYGFLYRPGSLDLGSIGRIRNPKIRKRTLPQFGMNELAIYENTVARKLTTPNSDRRYWCIAAHINLAFYYVPNEHRGA